MVKIRLSAFNVGSEPVIIKNIRHGAFLFIIEGNDGEGAMGVFAVSKKDVSVRGHVCRISHDKGKDNERIRVGWDSNCDITLFHSVLPDPYSSKTYYVKCIREGHSVWCDWPILGIVPIDSIECPICLTDQESIFYTLNYIKLSCSHIFHEKCITQWFEDYNYCPHCMKQLLNIK